METANAPNAVSRRLNLFSSVTSSLASVATLITTIYLFEQRQTIGWTSSLVVTISFILFFMYTLGLFGGNINRYGFSRMSQLKAMVTFVTVAFSSSLAWLIVI